MANVLPRRSLEPEADAAPAESTRGRALLLWVPDSKGKIVMLSFCFALLVFLVGLGLDLVLIEQHEPRSLTLEVSDAFTGIVAGLLFLQILVYWNRRRREMRHRLEMIAEMNHHIRNALQVIAFYRHVPPENEPLDAIDDAVGRIQWALKELLPKM